MNNYINNFYINSYAKRLSNNLGTMCKELRISKQDIEIKTTPGSLNGVLFYLQKHSLCLYKQLCDIACVDRPGNELRFAITYKLYSPTYNCHIYVIIQTNEVTPIPSVSKIYSSAI
jgi:NADH:ubiquinone oxidoreductase subunit C